MGERDGDTRREVRGSAARGGEGCVARQASKAAIDLHRRGERKRGRRLRIAAPTDSPRIAEVHYVGVDPGHWGDGVGAAVMARLAGELTSAGFVSAQLRVYANNLPARRLYERMGWVWDEQKPTLHPRSGRPEVRYRLAVGG